MRSRLLVLCLLASLAAVALSAATSTHVPTADGSTEGWTASGGTACNATDCYTEVDDTVGAHDSDTTYIKMEGASGSQLFDVTGITVPDGSTINSVAVSVYCRERDADDVVSLDIGLRVGGVTASSTGNTDVTNSYDIDTFTWNTNPNTAAAWTEAEVEGTDMTNPIEEIGIAGTNGSIAAAEGLYCTSIYLTVDYTAPGAGGGRNRLLLGVG